MRPYEFSWARKESQKGLMFDPGSCEVVLDSADHPQGWLVLASAVITARACPGSIQSHPKNPSGHIQRALASHIQRVHAVTSKGSIRSHPKGPSGHIRRALAGHIQRALACLDRMQWHGVVAFNALVSVHLQSAVHYL
eukprot:1156722-Pelagomonas_calceolata.AAC.9